MEYAYYAKLIKDGFHTQCTLDLESGAVKIQDPHSEAAGILSLRLHICMQEQSRMKKNGITHTGKYKNSWNQILYNAKQSISGDMEGSIYAKR